jgi:hypothetical protein
LKRASIEPAFLAPVDVWVWHHVFVGQYARLWYGQLGEDFAAVSPR